MNCQTKKGIKSSHLVGKSKIRMICLQPSEGWKFNFIYQLINGKPLLLKNFSIPVTPDNPNTRKSDQI